MPAAEPSATIVAAKPPPSPAPIPVRAIPAGWASKSAQAFEREVAAWVAPGERVTLERDELEALTQALHERDASSVRAAVLLARSGDPQAGEALLVELERRIPPSAGHEADDAADVVAARAFALGAEAPNAASRLLGLGVGKRPHPDLEVRVECAASALALGRDRAIPFLIKILRERSPSQVTKPDWTRKDDMDWAQWRASVALAARANVITSFDPRGSIASREREASRLEALLVPRAKSNP